MKKIILTMIIILGFVVRLYRLNNPIADWHSWRQADTSAVSRYYAEEGINLFYPRYHDLSDVASRLKNPEGYRFVEFPFYNALQAMTFKALPYFSLEEWGRLVSITFSLITLFFLYLLVKKYLGETQALWAAFFYAFLPFNIYYSRTILPESMMIASLLGAIYFFDQGYGFLAIIFGAIALLIKPYILIFLLPVVYLGWRQWHFNFKKWAVFIFCFLISLLPFLAWRWHMSRFPEGIPSYLWLFNLAGIRFKGAFFWWIFGERIGKLILGGWGLVPLGLGLILKPSKKEGLLFASFLAASLIYLLIIASGNVTHDYYQVLAIPMICIFLAKGSHFLSHVSRLTYHLSPIACRLLLITCLLFMLAFSWYQVRDFFNINNPSIIKAGQAADQLLPQTAKVIASYGGDTAFLYQTKRQGWPIGGRVDEFIKDGAQYYISVKFDQEAQTMIEDHCLLAKTDEWLIVDLTKTCSAEP